VLFREVVFDNMVLDEGFDLPLLLGGPVQPETLWSLHSPDFQSGTTTNAHPDFRISGIREVVEAKARGAGPRHLHLGCGFSGWGPGQLESEIEEGSWWLTDFDAEVVLTAPYGERWELALKRIGIDLESAPLYPGGEEGTS
jgi:putative transcriptional regulator